MKLSEMTFGHHETLYKNGEFQCFGLLNYNTPGKMLSFFGNKSFRNHLSNSKISCIICKAELLEFLPAHIEGIIISENPLLSFWDLHERYGRSDKYDFPTSFGSNNKISGLSSVDKIGVRVGNNVVVEEFVTIRSGVTIADNVIIRAGSVLGGECFELSKDGEYIKMASLYGGLTIGENAYVGYNSTLIKGTFEWETSSVGRNTKIDSNSYISHNVKIGERGVITSGVIINGDVEVGNDVWMSPGVNITNSVSIGKSVSIMLGSKVTKNVADEKVVVDGKEYDKRLLDAIKKKD